MINYQTAEKALQLIKSGERVFIQGGAATPQHLINTLVARNCELSNVEIVHMHTEGEVLYAKPEYSKSFHVNSFFVANNLTTERIFRVFGYATDLQSGAVSDGAMAISSHQKYRIVWRYSIEIFASGEDGWLPKRFDPATACDPFAGLGLIDTGFNLGQEVLQVGDALEVQRHLALTDSDQVAVRIRESGQDRVSVQINDTGGLAYLLLCVGVRAYKNNAVAFDRDGLSVRLLVIGRVDVPVLENDIGWLGLGSGG